MNRMLAALVLMFSLALVPSVTFAAREVDPCLEPVWLPVGNHLVYVPRDVATSPLARKWALNWYQSQREQYSVGSPLWAMFNDNLLAGRLAEAKWPKGITCQSSEDSGGVRPVTNPVTPPVVVPPTVPPTTPPSEPPTEPPPSDPPPAPDPGHGGGNNHDPQPGHGHEGEHGNGSPHGGH